MKVTNLNEAQDYLTGAKFSSAYFLALGRRHPYVGRVPLVASLCADQRVIHVGCVDHLPLIEEKIARGNWLHGEITRVASACMGLDINREGIDFLRARGIGNVHFHDILGDEPLPGGADEAWDVMVLGEVLEHIDNPVLFLQRLRARYQGRLARVVLTVPNAFSFENIKLAAGAREYINTDHRFWFTPFTLAKVLTSAGFTVQGFAFCDGFPRPLWLPSGIICRLLPAYRDTVVMVAAL